MKKMLSFALIITLLTFNGMALTSEAIGSDPKDGELNFPTNHKTFSKFLSGIQKPKHVRDLFLNEVAAKTQKGDSFANGSILVMEIYNAKLGADGKAAKGPDGKNVRAELAKVYVMQKEKGWGKSAPKGKENGDWIFSAFSADGKPIKADYNKCRSCHLPLKDKDFVHRYDEYFDKRQ
jgi:Cytochrome P460